MILIFHNRKEKQVSIELEEICQSLQFYELDKDEWWEVISDKVQPELKIKDLKTIILFLGIKDYISIPEKWKDKDVLTKKKYYYIYDEILSILDSEHRVKKQTISVTKSFEVTKHQGVICSESHIFRVSYGFSDYKMNQSYVIYSIGMEILGCMETDEEGKQERIDLLNANIRVLLSYNGQFEWAPEEISFQLTGKYQLFFNDNYIKDVNNTSFLLAEYMKPSEIGIHHKLGNRMELVPCDDSSRCYVHYGKKASNAYRGKIYVYPKEDGCFIVNELPIEQYLYSVVPSEMPASYEPEALKAQAVCARSYAYQHVLNGGRMDYYAHVDDTTNYQVYNKTPEQASTNKAVDETKGVYVSYRNEIATTYYFSTSIGNTASGRYWGMEEEAYDYLTSYSRYGILDLSEETDFQTFISKNPTDDYESNCKYYRWKGILTLDQNKLLARISERLKSNSGVVNILPEASWGEITSMYVKERDSSGGIQVLAVVYGDKEIYIQGEYNIRYCLGGFISDFELKNEEHVSLQLLPSAFFYIEEIKDGICIISGGGYGHGIGMSQNGANGMAQEGYLFHEILELYFKDCKLVSQSEEK